MLRSGAISLNRYGWVFFSQMINRLPDSDHSDPARKSAAVFPLKLPQLSVIICNQRQEDFLVKVIKSLRLNRRVLPPEGLEEGVADELGIPEDEEVPCLFIATNTSG